MRARLTRMLELCHKLQGMVTSANDHISQETALYERLVVGIEGIRN